MENKLVIGGIYRHFKGNYYIVEALVNNAESDEQMVLYRPLYEDGALWVRLLDSFLGLVDQKKYPECLQKYRFEYLKVERVKYE